MPKKSGATRSGQHAPAVNVTGQDLCVQQACVREFPWCVSPGSCFNLEGSVWAVPPCLGDTAPRHTPGSSKVFLKRPALPCVIMCVAIASVAPKSQENLPQAPPPAIPQLGKSTEDGALGTTLAITLASYLKVDLVPLYKMWSTQVERERERMDGEQGENNKQFPFLGLIHSSVEPVERSCLLLPAPAPHVCAHIRPAWAYCERRTLSLNPRQSARHGMHTSTPAAPAAPAASTAAPRPGRTPAVHAGAAQGAACCPAPARPP